jgi:hypothetical protein
MYITEYKDMAIYPDGAIQIPQEPPLAIQVVTFTTSTASAALNSATKFVSVQLNSNGHVQFAATPVATTTTSRLHEANAVSFHGVDGSLKIAAIDAA